MRVLLTLFLLMLGCCADFRAIEMPTDPHRACEIRCNNAIASALLPHAPISSFDVWEKACNCDPPAGVIDT